MKKIASLALAALFILAACNNKKPKDSLTVTSEDGKEKVSIDVNQMQNSADEMEKKKEELSKLPPLTLDQLKALLPETLVGAKRTDYNVANTMGAGLGTATYTINDSSDIKLNIYDCAGTAGAGIYSMQFLGLYNIQQESETEYTKTIDFNGGKAFEHCDKTNNQCTLTYFSGERFLVTLEGNHTGVDALKQAAGQLSLK